MDWVEWHAAYDENSPLHHRLLAVQHRVREALDARPPGVIRVVSVCAGESRDLLEVLEDHPRMRDVRGRLVELDPELASRAATRAPSGIEVVRGDAGLTDAYIGAVPANLVLVCGVFGNLSVADIEGTVGALPGFCAPGATVIWTRHRKPPDVTIDVRRWFGETGFELEAFDAPADFHWSVGVHRFAGAPVALEPGRRLFSFLPRDDA